MLDMKLLTVSFRSKPLSSGDRRLYGQNTTSLVRLWP